MTSAPLITPRGESGFLFTFQDVTELKKRDREARVQQRLAAVGEMAAGIAHEIRNPLASMAGSIQILRDELPLTPDQSQLMDIVLRESDRLNDTIRSFLSFAKPQRMAVADLDVRQVLTDTARLLQNSADVTDDHSIVVVVPDEPVVYRADEAQIRQIVWNLATNGLRAMPNGRAAAARVRGGAGARGPGRRDGRGRGRRRRRHRARGASTASSSRSAAASPTAPASACRSSIGSRATMAARSGSPRSREKARAWRWRCPWERSIPRTSGRSPTVRGGTPDMAVTVTAERAATASESARILVVDDERSMREMLAILLKREGHEVSVAENGRAAIALLDQRPFDLVVSDARMPDLDGLEVLRHARSINPSVIAIMVTAYGSPDLLRGVAQLGVNDYVEKPFNTEVLRFRIRKELDRKRLQQENVLLKRAMRSANQFANIIGNSSAMLQVFEMVETIAPTGQHGADHGGVRDGQGARRARHPRAVAAERPAVRGGELRRADRDAARLGALRPHARIVHRRGGQPEGAHRDRRQGDDLPRRDRRDEPDAAGQDPARPAGAQVPPRRRQRGGRGRHPDHRGDQPRPGEDGQRRASSARTCSTGSTSSRSACRRSASGSRTSRSSRSTSSPGSPSR